MLNSSGGSTMELWIQVSSGKKEFDVFKGCCIRAGLSWILLGKMKLLNTVETLILKILLVTQPHIEAISKLAT